MAITAAEVATLRKATSAGMKDCKDALEAAGGDFDKAVEILRKAGVAKAAKKAGREANEGLVGSYVHTNARLATLVELNCESDFVARNEMFQALLKDLCMQVAATNPLSVRPEDLPEDLVEKEKEIYRAEAGDKPEHIVDKIVEGKLRKFYEERCLLEQPFIKDDKVKIKDLVTNLIATLGENIQIGRIARIEIGA